MPLQQHNTEKGQVFCPITALLLVIFSILTSMTRFVRRKLSYNSPATSDLFDPYFNDEICEEKVTDSLLSCRVSSPETNELFEATVSEETVISVPIPVKFFM